MALDREELLQAYDEQIRTRPPEEPGVTPVIDPPFVRTDFGRGCFLGWVGGEAPPTLHGDELVAALVAQWKLFPPDEPVEWKTYGHVENGEMLGALEQAGFEPEERETIVVAETSEIAGRFGAPEGVVVRRTANRDDFERIARMQWAVWEENWSKHLADELTTRQEAAGDRLEIWIAEANGQVVSSAWITFTPGTDFAGLWGGSTLAEWRGRGLYRALVSARADSAAQRAVPFLQVDASDDSRPILERLGFVTLTTTTPYVHPAAASRS